MAHLIRDCTTCGRPIVFRPNSEGKYIPFDYLTGVCHFETCTKKPNLSLNNILKPKGVQKSKIRYSESIKNQTLKAYISY